MDGSGDLYVVNGHLSGSSSNPNKVQVYNTNQTGDPEICTWGAYGSGSGDFIQAMGIAVSPSGDVYVADASNLRVSEFDPDLSNSSVCFWAGVTTAAGSRTSARATSLRRNRRCLYYWPSFGVVETGGFGLRRHSGLLCSWPPRGVTGNAIPHDNEIRLCRPARQTCQRPAALVGTYTPQLREAPPGTIALASQQPSLVYSASLRIAVSTSLTGLPWWLTIIAIGGTMPSFMLPVLSWPVRPSMRAGSPGFDQFVDLLIGHLVAVLP